MGHYAPAAALAIVLIGVLAWNLDLQFSRRQVPDAFAITLNGDGTASGRLVYVGSQESGMLVSEGLPDLAAGRAYQVWAVTRKGLESRGLFTIDESGRGFATIAGDLDADRPILVTVEPASGSSQPSGPRVLSTAP
jgi:anti-sigma-K factor RskA